MSIKSLNLRQAIVERVKGKSEEELAEVIHDSIGTDERALPGLGVLFEMIWQNIDEAAQKQLVTALHGSLNEE